MKKKSTNLKLVILLLGFSFAGVYAQQSPISSGGNAVGSGGNVSYSIGQMVFTTDISPAGTVSMGVQQPFEIFTLGKNDFPEIDVVMKVYPNPTTSFVNLNIGNSISNSLEYRLFDLNGKQISNQKISQQETQIQFENLPSSTYFLNVLDRNKTIKTFKIIKKY